MEKVDTQQGPAEMLADTGPPAIEDERREQRVGEEEENDNPES